MTLTTKERLNLYKYIRRCLKSTLKHAENGWIYITHIGMCNMIETWQYNKKKKFPITISELPELWKRQPKKIHFIFWYSLDVKGIKQRLALIEKVIQETEQLMRTEKGTGSVRRGR